jgi:ABC-type transport system involved in multi-copper enzyme maturation permease subunit
MTSGFRKAFKAELYVAVRTMPARLIIIVPALIVLARLLVEKMTQSGTAAREALMGQSGFDESTAGSNAYGHFVDGLSTGLTVLSLALVAYAAWSFASDRDTGALRHVLIRQASRRALIVAKLAIVHVVALLALLLIILTVTVTTGFLWEFGPIVEDGYELIGTEEIQREIQLGLQLALLPLPAAIAFGMLVSLLTNSATQAVTAALGATLALDIFKDLLGNVSHYLYVSFQPSLIDQSYLKDVGRLVRGYSDVLVDERILTLNQWVPLPQMLLLAALALLIVPWRKL